MKANAPEKIYIHVRANKELGTTWHGKKITNSDIEYVRKDAFIEKAAGWLSDNTLSGLCLDFGNAEIVREFVDNFKNYMKGE